MIETVVGPDVTSIVTVYENKAPVLTDKTTAAAIATDLLPLPDTDSTTTSFVYVTAPPAPPAADTTTPVLQSPDSSSTSSAATVDAAAVAPQYNQNQNKQPKAQTTSTSVAAPKPVTSSTLSSSTPATPASNGGSSTGKRGLAFEDVSLTTGFGGAGSQVSWGYNWQSSCGTGLKEEYAPMLWGLDSGRTGVWNKNADAGIAAGAKHILS